MRTRGDLLVLLGLGLGLSSLTAPRQALGNVIGMVDEGKSLTLNVFTLTNPNDSAVELNGYTFAVVNPHFGGPDPDGDFVTGIKNAPGGTCDALLGVPGGFLAKSTCTVSLTFTTPDPDEAEPADFGTSQITFGGVSTPGGVSSPFFLFEIQVNDPVPEPGSASLLGLGSTVLLCFRWAMKRWTDVHGS